MSTVVKKKAVKKVIPVKADSLPPKMTRTPKEPGLCVNGNSYGIECEQASLHYYQNGGPNSDGCRGAACRAINTEYYAARRRAGKDTKAKASTKVAAKKKKKKRIVKAKA